MNNENVLVISHRRSGTHLTIDSIRNNFKALRANPYVVLETVDRNHPDHQSIDQLRQTVSTHCRIIKTHYFPGWPQHCETGETRFVSEVFANSKKIYVVRNGMDVLASLYEFRRGHDAEARAMDFGQFIRQPSFDTVAGDYDKVEYWAFHVRSWLNAFGADQMLVIHFEDWVNDYRGTLKKVAKFLRVSKDWFSKDVRMGATKRKKEKQIERTWVEPRKGKIGDHVNYFMTADREYFDARCGTLMKQLGYS